MRIRVYKKCNKHYIPDGNCSECKLIEVIDRKPFNKGFVIIENYLFIVLFKYLIIISFAQKQPYIT